MVCYSITITPSEGHQTGGIRASLLRIRAMAKPTIEEAENLFESWLFLFRWKNISIHG